MEWLKTVFIPQTVPRDPLEPRLLILDGHGSHETLEFMWECYLANIYLLFLPPHTSHVLQPLDLMVFAALKNAYRKRLGMLPLHNDSTPLGKQNFMDCYYHARLAGLTASNIIAGFRTTGLWPVSLAKPLMSKLMLENSNKASITPEQSSRTGPVPNWTQDQSSIIIQTPHKPEDIRGIASQITGLETVNSATARVLFRKIAKSIDQQDLQITCHKRRIEQLEARVVQLAP